MQSTSTESSTLSEPLGRFRPADEVDFSRRAKALARVLVCKLQEAQELLARIYGYAHAHELKQVLKALGLPGPYTDAPLGSDAPASEEELRLERNQRTMRIVMGWCHKMSREHRTHGGAQVLLVCDLGLFLSPPLFRACAKVVDEHLKTREKGISPEGFPLCYNGVIFGQYRYNDNLDEASVRSFAFPEGWFRSERLRRADPQEQYNVLQRARAPAIFLNLCPPNLPNYLGDLEEQLTEDSIDLWPSGYVGGVCERLLQANFDEALLGIFQQRYERKTGRPPSEEDETTFFEVLDDPTDERIAACALTAECPDLRSRLPHWRFQLRRLSATILKRNPDYDEDDEPRIPLLLDVYRPGRSLTVLFQKRYCGSMQMWSVMASYLRQEVEGAPWKLAGCLAGDYVVPFEEGTYTSIDNMVLDFDDAGHTEMCRVWRIIERAYLQRAGFLAYEDFVNQDAPAVANLSPLLVPEYRGQGELGKMLEMFSLAFDEGCAITHDHYWRQWGDLTQEEGEGDDFGEDDLPLQFEDIGVMFVPLYDSGSLAMSVWSMEAEQPTATVLRQKGENVRAGRSGRGRRVSLSVQDSEQRGLISHLMRAAKEVPVDVVVYDPNDPWYQGDSGG